MTHEQKIAQITNNSRISLGVIITVVGMAGSVLAFCYNAVNDALTTQEQRITKLEDTIFSMNGEIHEINGKMDSLLKNQGRRR
jgi:TolA-binding protein